MRLKTVSLNHHKVLGSVKINFFGNSLDLTGKPDPSQTDIHIDIDRECKKEQNYFTYIIGQNGVGKTILFRTIINFINNNSPEVEPRLLSLINFYTKSKKYIQHSIDKSYLELSELGIKQTSAGGSPRGPLNDHDAYLLFISSSFERVLVHKNARYRNYNYLTDINKTQTLFLKALVRFRDTNKLNILAELLNKRGLAWHFECTIYSSHPVDARISMKDFVRATKKIRVSDNNIAITEELDKEELAAFTAIYESEFFFKFYFDTDLNFHHFFESIRNSQVFKEIEAMFANDDPITPTTLSGFSSLVFSEFDINTLLLLENLGLIRLSVGFTEENSNTSVPLDRMSSGEQSIIRVFSFFSDLPPNNSNQNFIVFFDEPENTLHPQWQHNFPRNFKKIVEEIYEIKNSHFFFSTHSPLIIMRAGSIENSNVIQFTRDENRVFKALQVKNINSFSVEQVLLDEFKISYRDREIQSRVEQILKKKSEEMINSSDPIDAVERSFELKKKIDDLFNKIKTNE